MKRGLPVLIFLLCCAGRGPAQSAPPAAAADAPPGVAVVKFNWERIQRRTEFDNSVYSAASQTVEDPRAGTLPQDTGTLRLPAPVGRSSSATRDSARQGRSTVVTAAPSGSDPNAAQGSRPAPGGGAADDHVYQLRIKNGGERRVESVDWECLFLDPGTKKELGRHRFITARRVKPGETLTLAAASASPPTRVVSAAALDKKRKAFDERVVVRCVAYADGTFARRDGAPETDCDGLREAATRARRQ